MEEVTNRILPLKDVMVQRDQKGGKTGFPLGNVTPHVVNIKAESGSIVSAPILWQNDIGGGVSNYFDVKETGFHRERRRKVNSEDSAGPATKRTRSEICGYVHDVSQLKPMSFSASGEEKHFSATLQTSSGNVSVVVFDRRSHQAFCDAQSDKVPVSLNNVRVGRSHQEVKFSCTSQLSHMKSVDFEYDHKSCEPKSVASVLEATQCPTAELITITGKIKEETDRSLKNVYGMQMMMIKYLLADNSAFITLTVWEGGAVGRDINPGCWYTFSHVRVKKFCDQKELTFTPHTKVTEVPAQGNVVDACSSQQSRKFKVLSSFVENRHFCICDAELPLIDPDCTSVKCSTCKHRVSAQSVICVTKACITVQAASRPSPFNVPKSCIKPLLGLEREGFCDKDEAEEKLLQMKWVEVVFQNDKVVEIKKATEGGDQD